MKDIRLLNLSLTNFKGIKWFELDANGEDIKVYGDNATGKTTLFDAFVWLLFDTDSKNSTDFQIKTLKNGKVIHKLDHEVSAVLLVDGQKLELKKVYKEKWTKKRGSATAKFTGHTTDCYINGVPCKKTEYREKVKSIVDEDAFKLLTNPAYFNEKYHWKDRRKLLLEIAGDITDEDVIRSNNDLAKLLDILNGRSIEEHKKIIASKRKNINQELERIPIRIDELNRNLPETNGLNEEEIKAQLELTSSQIEEKQQKINDIKNGGEISKLKAQINDIDLKIANVKNEHSQQGQQELYSLRAKLQEEQSNVSILKSKITSLEQWESINNSNIKEYEEQMAVLRQQWKEHHSQEFDHDANCTCPTCGQELPEEQIDEAVAKFNRNKSDLLEKINKKGLELKAKVEQLQNDNFSIDLEKGKLINQIIAKNAAIEKLESKIQEFENSIQPIDDNQIYQQLMQERQALKQEIEKNEISVDASIESIQKELEALKEKQSSLQMDLSRIKQAEQARKRIEELEQQEKDLAAEFEQLEHELYLTEEFTRTKVNLLEEKINSKFTYATFKLFDEQINGGLTETCETLYEGVPYSGGLNNAAKINVGLDIINTLSEHYGIRAPIFIDNAESVTNLIDIDSQLIRLIVSEKDKQLRVETQLTEIKEAI